MKKEYVLLVTERTVCKECLNSRCTGPENCWHKGDHEVALTDNRLLIGQLF